MEVMSMDSPSSKRPWLCVYPDWMPHDLKLTPSTALDLFRTAAVRRPEIPAVYYFDQEISYGEIDRLSDSLAAALRDLGLRKGDRIVLDLYNIPQFLIAQYGAWKAGAIVVPLDPASQENELTHFLQDSGAKILVTQEEIISSIDLIFLKNTSVEIIITTSPLDMVSPEAQLPSSLSEIRRMSVPGSLDIMELLARYEGKRPVDPGLFPDDVAYLTYTSGTTGPPKGVMNTHGNVAFNAGVYKVSALMNENDVILGIAPLFNITGEVGHLAVAALNGIPVILCYRFDPCEALRLIERWRATMTVAPTGVFIALMDHPDIRHRDIRSLRKAYSVGAPLSAAVVKRFEELTGNYIHNVYGLTETTSTSHITPLGKRMPVDSDSGALSVGLPVPNSLAKIVDLKIGNEELGPGDVGEIVIKGPMVVPGYWGNAKAKKRAIRDDWLFTGDVGKMDEDGWFYVLDRKKASTSVSGYETRSRGVEGTLPGL
jgi:long-chain acyl-CoA synthetase